MDKELSDSYIKKLKQFQDEDDDWEISHSEADRIVCELLMDLGYDDFVVEYEKVPKWFA